MGFDINGYALVSALVEVKCGGKTFEIWMIHTRQTRLAPRIGPRTQLEATGLGARWLPGGSALVWAGVGYTAQAEGAKAGPGADVQALIG